MSYFPQWKLKTEGIIAPDERLPGPQMVALGLQHVVAMFGSTILAPILMILSLPCIFGFNIWSGFQPLGPGSCVLDLEDFIVSNNVLPLGSLLFILFCTCKCGWGWDNFIKESNTGLGTKIPQSVRGYLTYVLPLIIIYIYVQGYISIFCK